MCGLLAFEDPIHMTTNTNTEMANGGLDGADKPCPAVGANRIVLMTSEARAKLEARFMERTKWVPETGCLETTYAPTTDGYGMCWITGIVTAETHRVAYVLAHGPIPAKLKILHSCHNPLCVNPDHLRLGTHKENMRDMVEAGRKLRGPGSNPRKLTVEAAMIIQGDRILGVSMKETARDLDVPYRLVGAVRSGKRWAPAITAHIDAFLAVEAAERDRKLPAK